jgi:putative sterol carrier protein
VVDDGRTRAARGRAPSPNLVLRSSFEDWIDVTAGRADPAKLVLRRRLRPSGDLKLVLRLPKIFA